MNEHSQLSFVFYVTTEVDVNFFASRLNFLFSQISCVIKAKIVNLTVNHRPNDCIAVKVNLIQKSVDKTRKNKILPEKSGQLIVVVAESRKVNKNKECAAKSVEEVCEEGK
jgi:hypothetical protein